VSLTVGKYEHRALAKIMPTNSQRRGDHSSCSIGIMIAASEGVPLVGGQRSERSMFHPVSSPYLVDSGEDGGARVARRGRGRR
jgi:hypothetical protein